MRLLSCYLLADNTPPAFLGMLSAMLGVVIVAVGARLFKTTLAPLTYHV